MRALIFGLLALSLAWASPSAFPENAAYVRLGVSRGVYVGIGGELLLPVPFVDLALGGEAFIATGRYGARLDISALFFPALGTTPPTALGAGGDVRLTSERFAIHAGPVIGTDLLFVADLPITLSLYAALGFDSTRGLSPAWALAARYYFEALALELASRDDALISLALRYLF